MFFYIVLGFGRVFRSRRAFWVLITIFLPKEFVLNEFLELSETPIHFSNAPGRSLTIPDEFGVDYGRITAGLLTGLFFAQTPDRRHQFVESALELN